jgi:hypothetical protein
MHTKTKLMYRLAAAPSLGGEQHEQAHLLVHVAHLAVLARTDQRLAELVGDVAADSDHSRDAEVHHARGHEEGAPAADESAQRAADEPEHDDLQHRHEVQGIG